MRILDFIETATMLLICLFDYIEKLYVKIFPYAALSIGFIILLGLAGGAEGQVNENYFLSIIEIAISFIILSLLWKIGKLKNKKEA